MTLLFLLEGEDLPNMNSRVMRRIFHPESEPGAAQVLALCESGPAGCEDGVHLVVPAGGDTSGVICWRHTYQWTHGYQAVHLTVIVNIKSFFSYRSGQQFLLRYFTKQRFSSSSSQICQSNLLNFYSDKQT